MKKELFMTRKADTISYKEFNKLTNPKGDQVTPEGVLFDDENINSLEETLMGMEYDVEDLDELEDEEDNEIMLEALGEEDEEDEEDLIADRNDEVDESAYYRGRQL
nr:hypothetical protein BHI3_10270 [Bacteriovorax sp. HI3]